MRLASLLSLLLLVVMAARAEAASVADPRLEVTGVVTGGLAQITSLAWAPDGTGRLFVTEKAGTVRLVVDGVLQSEPFASESVFTNGEGGLLGLAFDPDYLQNRYVYVFVTVSASQQAIVRYSDLGGPGSDRKVIVSGLPSAGNNHVGGGLGFGPDGRLYWAIGDLGNGTGVDADLVSLASKVSRAEPDGKPSQDNPFNDGVGPNNEFTWARGFRNPYTLTFHPRTGALWVNSVGTAWEQSFLVTRGSHAGWNDYEANQPAANYLAPRLAYPTNATVTRAVQTGTGATRSGGVATFTTTVPHLFRPGQRLTLTGVADASFNGIAYVRSVPEATAFTVSQAGPDASSGGGSARTDHLGGCITGGAFYDSTLFPDEYREDFLFGDFNSGRLIRARFTEGEVSRVDAVGEDFTSNTDVAVGPDGAVYTSGIDGTIRRIAPHAPGDTLVLSSRHVRVVGGSEAQIAVRLSRAPTGDVTVRVAGTHPRLSVDRDVLTFTPGDWDRPHFLRIRATPDAVKEIAEATFTLAAPGYADQTLTAFTMERRAQALAAATAPLVVPRGGSQEVRVGLQLAPSATVPVTARLEGSASLLSIAAPDAIALTPQTWRSGEGIVLQAASSTDAPEAQEDVLILEATGMAPLRIQVSVPAHAVEPPDDAGVPDAGAPDDGGPGDDAGIHPDAGETASDAGVPPEDEAPVSGGCGCHGTGAGLPFVLGGILVLLRRRRD